MKALQGFDTLQAEYNATLDTMESGMVSPAHRARLSIKLDVLQMFSAERLGSLPLTDEQIISDAELNFATKELAAPESHAADAEAASHVAGASSSSTTAVPSVGEQAALEDTLSDTAEVI